MKLKKLVRKNDKIISVAYQNISQAWNQLNKNTNSSDEAQVFKFPMRRLEDAMSGLEDYTEYLNKLRDEEL